MAESGVGVDAIDIYGDDLNEDFHQNVSYLQLLHVNRVLMDALIIFCSKKISVVMERICTMMYLQFQQALETEMDPR